MSPFEALSGVPAEETRSAPLWPSRDFGGGLFAGIRRTAFSFSNTASGRSALAMVDQTLVSAVNFLLLIAVARNAGVTQTGYYVLALRAVDFITEIQNVFLWAPYALFAPEYAQRDRKTYAGSVLIHQMLTSLATLLLIGAVAFVALLLNAHAVATVALWAMAASIGTHTREFTRRIGFANFDFLQVLIMDSGTFLLQVIGVAMLWIAHQISGWGVLAITSITALTGAAGYLLLLRDRFQFDAADVLPSLRKNVSYGRWLLGSDITLLLSNQIYPWFLSAVSGAAVVALFAAAQAITNFARMFLIGAQNVLLPSSARTCASKDLRKLRGFVRRSTMTLTAGASLFSIFCLAAGKPLLKLIYGAAFASHGFLTFLLSLSILAMAVTLAQTFALAAARRADANVRINVIILIFHCLAGLPLARFYGAEGAAWGLALGGFLAAALRWRLYENVFNSAKIFEG
jgi:O-antigen/teichoic acid export membrane protein